MMEIDSTPTPVQQPVGVLARLAGSTHIWSLLMLLAAAASLLLLQNSKTGFEGGSHHGWLSSHGITLAKNLVIDGNGLFMFIEKFRLPDGSIAYDPYNPFPVFSFLLIGLVILPLEPDLAAQVMAAYQLMNLFFAGAMLLCFLALRILLRNPWQALIVTLLAFSSHYMLTYHDMIFNDVPALFGVMLMLFLVVKSESGSLRMRSLMLWPILAISMGWQPYALLAAWLLLDWLRALWTRQPLRTLLRRPALIAFATAVAWGGLVLTMQILNEWRVMGGTLPSVTILQKAATRLGLMPDAWYLGGEKPLPWPVFLEQQMNRTAVMIVPFGYGLLLRIREVLAGGALLFGFGIFWFRRQLPLFVPAVLLLACVMWTAPMKQFVSVHDFQTLFLAPGAIVFFTVLVMYLRPSTTGLVAGIVLALFVLTIYRINQEKGLIAPLVNATTAEFQAIYEQLPRGSNVFVCGERYTLAEAHHAVDFYLAGSYSTRDATQADYLVIRGNKPAPDGEQLTNNPNINLIRRQAHSDLLPRECGG